MRRLIVVCNSRSSKYRRIRAEVLDKVNRMTGILVGKYEVLDTDVDDNAERFSKILKDGDVVLAVGGDATAAVAANGILLSGRDVTLAVLPYGNFNDLARTLGVERIDDVMNEIKNLDTEEKVIMSADRKKDGMDREKVLKKVKFWPLEIWVDGKFFRYATCYVTIGMTAEAVRLFDDAKIRKRMQKSGRSSWRSYLQLAGWYFKNRGKREFLPEFKLNGVKMAKGTSDYAAVNGRYMAKVMKGGEDFLDAKKFRSETGQLTNIWNLGVLMAKSVLKRTPGAETNGDILEFEGVSPVAIQAEGEYRTFENVKKIEIRKAKKCLWAIIKL